MFCGKCGTKLNNNDVFCPECGSQILENTSAFTQNNNKKNTTKRISIPVLIGVALVVLIILNVSLTGGGGYKKTLDNYYKAHENNDADLMYSSVIAQYWIDYTNEGWGNSAYESIKDSIEGNIKEWNCGDDIKITYKIKNEKRATKEQLKDLEDNIYDWYAYYVYERDDFYISDAYVLDIDFTVVGDKGTESFHYPDGLLVIKKNGKWRITRGSIGSSFYDNQ